MKVRLLDYRHEEHWVDVPENTKYLKGEIISGDMVLTEPIFFDTGNTELCRRIMNFFDGSFIVPISDLKKFNSIERSYDVFDLEDEI